MFELGDNKQMDILILDIEMPKMSGFEIANYVKKSNPNCLIIFMTSHVNYAVDGYKDINLIFSDLFQSKTEIIG